MERASRIAGISVLVALLVAGPTAAQPPAERTPPLSPLIADSLAPLLAMLITAERDNAKAQGVEPIPAAIRAALQGYVPEETLDRVRWREGGTVLSLPQNVIRFGHVPAMTLDDVIVFQERRAALEDPKLWAHELTHVVQFARWGVSGFATQYLRDYEAVEREAAEFRWQFMKEKGLVPAVAPPRE
ncbi:MAG TPA: DUF4157 domain-containing protein [Gammaproteobacteria bacterium]|nr:DUF4157 domain-containing protein [Gammaproteobacteria bacterium]